MPRNENEQVLIILLYSLIDKKIYTRETINKNVLSHYLHSRCQRSTLHLKSLTHFLHISKYHFFFYHLLPKTKMPRFDVDFADPKQYFHPGETLAGTITMRVDEPMRTKQITLEFEGKSHVSWRTGHGEDMKFHWNNEKYFKHKDILLPPTSPPEEGTSLQVGKYSYPFQYQLPNALPPSFIAPMTSGYVQYCMNITVEDIAQSAPRHPDSQIPFKVID